MAYADVNSIVGFDHVAFAANAVVNGQLFRHYEPMMS